MSKHTPTRRDEIYAKLQSRTDIVDTGFEIDGTPSPCFLWNGPDSGDGKGGGYGRLSLNGHTCAVHLVAYTHFFGFIPGNKQVDHHCCQRNCWNPAHLELVSHLTNQRRRAARTKEKI